MSASKLIKIFLASASQLEEDRKEFELFINRQNKDLYSKDIFLQLVIWEDFIDVLSQTRLQDEYNKAIKECDIFVMLFFTKVGKYTREEFETAFGKFKETGKPLIYTFFKDAPITSGSLNREDSDSLFDFKEKLSDLGHFLTPYENIQDLKLQFKRQLDKILARDFTPHGSEPITKESPVGNIPGSPDYFIGRAALLEQLHQQLISQKNCCW